MDNINTCPIPDMSAASFWPQHDPFLHTGFHSSDFVDFLFDENPLFASIPEDYMVENSNNTANEAVNYGGNSITFHQETYNSPKQDGMLVFTGDDEQPRKEPKEKIAFRTKSEVEILDDGYKWRKYGKKMVKNSPNPRNYYKCSVEGCPVKKRVERDDEDPIYVVTTYEGVHNHPWPAQR